MRKVMFQDMTWREAEGNLKRCDIAILPVDSMRFRDRRGISKPAYPLR